MTDKELLELAANAAGGFVYVENMGWIEQDEHGNRGSWWNPFGDDGDALRLAVKLKMNFYTGYKKISAEILSDSDEPSIFITMHNFDGDALAATRRAIVRAAAEIGRTM